MYKEFCDYKWRIPVYGCALLTPDYSKVLLVKGFNQNSWGLPRGKVNEDEDELACALREAYEETGFDATYLNPKKEDKMYCAQKREGINGKTLVKPVTIFIVPGVPEDFAFEPTVVKEIEEIRWWRVSDLPNPGSGPEASKTFWGVTPFIKQLKAWITRKVGGAVNQEDLNAPANNVFGALEDDNDEFSVEEMFKVNRALRQKELQAEKHQKGTKAAKATKAASSKEKVSKDSTPSKSLTEEGAPSSTKKSQSKKKKSEDSAPKSILKRPESVEPLSPATPPYANADENDSTGFKIDWSSVAQAMRPYLH